jgi:hypothetical protein
MRVEAESPIDLHFSYLKNDWPWREKRRNTLLLFLLCIHLENFFATFRRKK